MSSVQKGNTTTAEQLAAWASGRDNAPLRPGTTGGLCSQICKMLRKVQRACGALATNWRTGDPNFCSNKFSATGKAVDKIGRLKVELLCRK